MTTDAVESPSHSSDDSTKAKRKRKSGPIVFDVDVSPVDASKVAISDEAVGAPGPRAAIAPAGEPTLWCRHNQVDLALHRLRAGRDESTPRLLHLHGLGEATPRDVPLAIESWPGAIWGLDFTGHGHSTIPRGGGYTAELLMADVDAALAHLGPTTIVGRGLGAYVALLIAGSRPGLVRGAILLDGPGMVGGGIGPGSPRITVAPTATTAPDPYALAELSVDLRPPDYALTYLHQAVQFSELDDPIAVCGSVRPPWLAAIDSEPGVRVEDITAALEHYAALPE